MTEQTDQQLQTRLEKLYEQELLKPCRTKQELQQWVKTFLGIDLPCETIDQHSTSNPVDFIWAVYEAALTGNPDKTTFVVAASRNSCKTLNAAIIEFLMMLHFGRDVIHLAAILDQSHAAIGYLNKFLRLPNLKKYSNTDNRREKLLENLPKHELRGSSSAKLKVIVATKNSSNAQRASCLPGTAEIPVFSNGSWVTLDIKSIYYMIANGEDVRVMSYTPEINQFEPRPVLAASRKFNKHRIELATSSGRKLTCTPDHRIAVFTDEDEVIYKRADELWAADEIIVRGAFSNYPVLEVFSRTKQYKVEIDTEEAGVVYDIQVAGNHNFIADDVLVHNCLVGDTLITVSPSGKLHRDHDKYIQVPIREVFAQASAGKSVHVLTVSERSGNLEVKPIQIVSRLEKSERVALELEDGTQIVMSEDHRMPIGWNENGLEAVEARALKVGDELLKLNGSNLSTNADVKAHFREPSFLDHCDEGSVFEGDSFTDEDIIEGSLLGDGFLSRRRFVHGTQKPYKGNFSFGINKSIKAEEYLQWLCLRECQFKFRIVKGAVSGYSSTSKMIKVTAGQRIEFTEYATRWYPEGKKIVPKDLKLTWQKLAILLMDDPSTGYRCVSTCGFSLEENELLASKINELVDFECATVRLNLNSKSGKSFPSIYLSFPKEQRTVLIKLFQLTHPAYKYKDTLIAKTCRVCNKRFYGGNTSTVCNDKKCRFKAYQMTLEPNKITRIVKYTEQGDQFVYDFQVKDNHNFFANKYSSMNCLFFDEVDLIDRDILSESAMIADPSRDGKPPIFVYLSSRKSASGPIQEKVDKAKDPKSMIELHTWSMVDFMKRCPPEIHLPDKPLKLYLHREDLDIKEKHEVTLLPPNIQNGYDEIQAFEGCRTCQAFVVCQARAPKQTQTDKKLLRDIAFVGTALRNTADAEKIAAQLLNLKPESAGTVYNRFLREKHCLNVDKAFEFAFGVPPPEGIHYSKETFAKMLRINQWKLTCGVDFGWTDSATAVLVAYHKASEKVIVLHTEHSPGYSNPDWLAYVKAHVFDLYAFDLLCPDTADASSPSVAARLGMPSRSKKPHKIETGVSWVRSKLWNPSKQNTTFCVIDDSYNEYFIDSMEKWQHLKTQMGFDFTKFEDDEFTHALDALRYAIDPFVVAAIATMSVGQGSNVIGIHGRKADPGSMKSLLQEHYLQEYGLDIDDEEKNKQSFGGGGISFSF